MDHDAELRRLAKTRERYDEAATAARLNLADAVRRAAADGVRQVDIVRATGYTREQIRRIVAGRTR